MIDTHNKRLKQAQKYNQEPNRKQTNVVKRYTLTKKSSPGRSAVRKKEIEKRRGSKRKPRHIEPPSCFNPECRDRGEMHYISHCPIADKETKATLLDDYRKAKRARLNAAKRRYGQIGRVSHIAPSPHSAFSGPFANGWLETDVKADQGADANFISEDLLATILRKAQIAKIVRFETEHVYHEVTGGPCLTYSKKVTLDVYLKIRHGSSLVLRNVD